MLNFIIGKQYKTRSKYLVTLESETGGKLNFRIENGGLYSTVEGRVIYEYPQKLNHPLDVVEEYNETNIMEPNIDFTKPVQTSNGRKVTIFTTEANGPHPVVGQIEGDTTIDRWSLTGEMYKGWSDLVNTKVKKIVPLGPQDIKPGDIVRYKDEPDTWQVVIGVKLDANKKYYFVAGNSNYYFENGTSNKLNARLLLSHDNGVTWHEFTKEIEE